MISYRLRDVREDKDYSGKDISNILHVSNSVFLRWERNESTIPTYRLYKLSNLYEINIDYLLGLTNIKKYIKKINTSSSTWSAYETCKTLILCSFLIEICLDKGYSADWVLGKTNIKYIKNIKISFKIKK